ncbi:putative SLC26A/SulP transporter [Helianthus annuus]|nr:putative SLC26A/SulP transporter [Helianthus annuus]
MCDKYGSGHLQPETTTISISIQPETMAPPEPHDICLPPKKTSFQKLKHKLLEVFFADDPLHKFKNQTRVTKFKLALQFVLPVFEWAPNYNVALLWSDVVSGLTIASLAIPQGISYAKLANLPPVIGLCKFSE